jgi:hypothetical protein
VFLETDIDTTVSGASLTRLLTIAARSFDGARAKLALHAHIFG